MHVTVPEVANRYAQENATEDCPQTANGDKADQDIAGYLEMLLHKHSKVLEQDGSLHTEKAAVVYPDRNPEPVEAIGLSFVAEVPVMLAHSILH